MHADEVEGVVAAWSRERPDLDLAPMRVMSRVTRLAQRLDSARAAAFAAHQLSGWEFDVLAALRRSGEPYRLSAGKLVEQTHVTSGTMTHRINGLTARGLVSRRADPTDRRGVLVALTDAGRRAVDGALTDLLDRERELLDGLEPADRDAVAGLLSTLLRRFEDQAAR